MIDPSGGPAMICAYLLVCRYMFETKRNQAALVAPLLFLFSFFFEESLGATNSPRWESSSDLSWLKTRKKPLTRIAWQKIKTAQRFFVLLLGFFHLRIFGTPGVLLLMVQKSSEPVDTVKFPIIYDDFHSCHVVVWDF